MLPITNANVANEGGKTNWRLEIGIGNSGNIGNIQQVIDKERLTNEAKCEDEVPELEDD